MVTPSLAMRRSSTIYLGAHSLGRARPENTGFSGPWDMTETGLDPGYYAVLNSDNLVTEIVNNTRMQ